MKDSDYRFLFIIAKRKLKDSILKELLQYETIICNTVYGKGWAKRNEILAALGLVSEQNKIVFLCLVNKNNVESIFGMLEQKFSFGQPDSGIAFTIPVKK